MTARIRKYRTRRVERMHAIDPARAFSLLTAWGCVPIVPHGRAATLDDAHSAKDLKCWYDGDDMRAVYSKPLPSLKRQLNDD